MLELGLDGVVHLIERLVSRRFAIQDLDDLIAQASMDGLGDGTDGHAKGLDGDAVMETARKDPSEVPSLGRSGALAVLTCEGGEVRAFCSGLAAQLCSARLDLISVLLGGSSRRFYQQSL